MLAFWGFGGFCDLGKPLNQLFLVPNIQNYLNWFQENSQFIFHEKTMLDNVKFETFENLEICVPHVSEIWNFETLELWNFEIWNLELWNFESWNLETSN